MGLLSEQGAWGAGSQGWAGLCRLLISHLRRAGCGERAQTPGPAARTEQEPPTHSPPPQLAFLWRTFLSLSFTWCPLLFLWTTGLWCSEDQTAGPSPDPEDGVQALPSDPTHPRPREAGTYSGVEPASSSAQNAAACERRTGRQWGPWSGTSQAACPAGARASRGAGAGRWEASGPPPPRLGAEPRAQAHRPGSRPASAASRRQR